MNLFRNTSWYRPAFLILVTLLAGVLSCKRSTGTLVRINTELGEIVVEVYPDRAPVTSHNFLEHVEKGTYTNSLFYRVVRMDNQPHNEVKIEVIQGGLFEDDILDTKAPIIHETTKLTGILHTDGVISMARMEPGTASTEFFICIGNQPSLDFGGERNPDGQGFAAFGKVVRGMEVARAIQALPDQGQYLVEKVSILHMSVIPAR
ncbi:MAG: peptidylprolyl isomerase [Bacteroidia bacterium]|nr:MAG: peptidylprolyl isomerase [Bacteroidia bacterium]